MKKIVTISLLFLLLSCKNKEQKIVEKKCEPTNTKKLVMYQMSEMAALMEQMYAESMRTKALIENGETPTEFPKYFLKINTSKFTDESDNDAFFKQIAQEYLVAQKLIYSDPNHATKHFNASVDACIKCHENKCGGPITRIKKLYIK